MSSKSKVIPRENHIMRYVSPSRLIKDSDTDQVVGVIGDAFKPREVDNGALSTTWIEFFDGDKERQIASSVNAIRKSNLKPVKNGGYAIGNVGAIMEACQHYKTVVRVLHSPEPDNEAHAEIRNCPSDNHELFEMLAADVFTDLRRNKDYPNE